MHASRFYYLTRVAAAVAVLLVASAVQANPITYNLSNSFDATAVPATANPYNVWSCGILPTPASPPRSRPHLFWTPSPARQCCASGELV